MEITKMFSKVDTINICDCEIYLTSDKDKKVAKDVIDFLLDLEEKWDITFTDKDSYFINNIINHAYDLEYVNRHEGQKFSLLKIFNEYTNLDLSFKHGWFSIYGFTHDVINMINSKESEKPHSIDDYSMYHNGVRILLNRYNDYIEEQMRECTGKDSISYNQEIEYWKEAKKKLLLYVEKERPNFSMFQKYIWNNLDGSIPAVKAWEQIIKDIAIDINEHGKNSMYLSSFLRLPAILENRLKNKQLQHKYNDIDDLEKE